MIKSELDALITLLDDPHDQIYDQVSEKILSLGHEAIPSLELAWESCFPGKERAGFELLQVRIETIIHTIQFQDVQAQLRQWADSKDNSLLQGVLLIARYQYPDIDLEKINEHLGLIREDVNIEVQKTSSILAQINAINHVLFDIHKFVGNSKNFHAPQNSFINNVLEGKKGNPLSLSILYLLVCQPLGIPVFGINLPKHFIVAFKNSSDDIQFYINPFSRGTVFDRNDVNSFLKQLNIKPRQSFYSPCSNMDMIKRILINLEHSFNKQGYEDKVSEIKELMSALEEGS